jgi:hypothetical protein
MTRLKGSTHSLMILSGKPLLRNHHAATDEGGETASQTFALIDNHAFIAVDHVARPPVDIPTA